MDEFTGDHAIYGFIHLISRQALQYHSILRTDLKLAHQFLHELGLNSIVTANDVDRSAPCISNPVRNPLYQEAYEWAKHISMHLLPYTTTYADIWLDSKRVFTAGPTESHNKKVVGDVEPILGGTYLPYRLKTAVVTPPDNSVDTHSSDSGFITIGENGRFIGFNVLVDGGLSGRHGNTETYPNVSCEFGSVPLEYTLNAAEAVINTQRGWGSRSDREVARARCTLQHIGIEIFEEEVEKRMSTKFQPIHPYTFIHRGDRINWAKGLKDNWHLTLFVGSGCLLDYLGGSLETGIHKIAKIHPSDPRLTAGQDLVVANVPPGLRNIIDKVTKEHGLIGKSITIQRENSVACVALPTCLLTMTEAEHLLPSSSGKISETFAKYGLEDEYIVPRVTGCPNGCGYAMLAEIDLINKVVGRYNLYTGGSHESTRIPHLFRESITEPGVLEIVNGWVGSWTQNRLDNEGPGDSAVRIGIVKPASDTPHDF